MVLRAFCRAAVNSDFSANVDESIPYDLSSDLSSESFMDEMSGRSGMMQLVIGGVGVLIVALELIEPKLELIVMRVKSG